MWNLLVNAVGYCYRLVVIVPLQKLYFYGPNVSNKYGFWGGLKKSRICQIITTYTESFWEEHEEECLELLAQHFDSFRCTVEVMLYFALMYQLVKQAGRVLMVLLYAKCRPVEYQYCRSLEYR
jgi:hypothetical protein